MAADGSRWLSKDWEPIYCSPRSLVGCHSRGLWVVDNTCFPKALVPKRRETNKPTHDDGSWDYPSTTVNYGAIQLTTGYHLYG